MKFSEVTPKIFVFLITFCVKISHKTALVEAMQRVPICWQLCPTSVNVFHVIVVLKYIDAQLGSL